MVMIAKENFEVNYENAVRSIALQNKTRTAYSRNHVWLPCDLSCSYFTRLWSKKSVSISPPGKRAINLSRLHYRLLAICCSCFCINNFHPSRLRLIITFYSFVNSRIFLAFAMRSSVGGSTPSSLYGMPSSFHL